MNFAPSVGGGSPCPSSEAPLTNISFCIVCKNILVSKKKKKFCSDECKKIEYQKENSPRERQKEKCKRYKEENGLSYRNIKLAKLRIIAIDLLGGKCEICGYDKNISALEFHHKNPKEKEFGINLPSLRGKSEEKILKEVLKCSLFCSNCHRETHNPAMTKANIDSL